MIKALKLSSSKLISRIKNKWTLRMQSAFLTFTVRAKSEVYIRRKSLRPNLTAAIYTFIQCIKCMIMHLSSWLVEAYMRFLYFSELNHNSEFISAFKGGGIIFFFHYSFSKLIWFDSISRASHRHYYTRPAALCL